MINQHYSVNNKKFLNYFSAIRESNSTGHFVQFHLPDIKKFLDVDVNAALRKNPSELIAEKLIFLKNKNIPLRLHYSGGTDSHTILLTALNNNIKFDSVFVYLTSVTNSDYVNFEFIPGIKFLEKNKNLYNDLEIYNYSIDDYRVWNNLETPYQYTGFYHGFRPAWSEVFTKKLDKSFLEILGVDKPVLYVNKQGKYYWILTDNFDYVADTNHCDFYLDTIFPELTINQVYLTKYVYKTLLPNGRGWLCYKDLGFQQKTYNKIIGRSSAVSPELEITKTSDNWGNQSYLNQKHLRALQEIYHLGEHDIIESWVNNSFNLVKNSENILHGIKKKTVSLPDLGKKFPKSIELAERIFRIGAIFELHDTHLELMPFTDIQLLED